MDLLFEIGTEELPAGEIGPALDALAHHITRRAAEARLPIGAVETMATPRRLALLVRDIADAAETVHETVTGPPAKAGFDADGNPTKAALGFARGRGIDPADLRVIETDKGPYVGADVTRVGEQAPDLLVTILNDAFAAIPWKRSMRWGWRTEAFSRPVHWIVALLDDAVLPVTFAGVESGRVAFGHRFMAPEAIDIQSIDSWASQLRDAWVMVDPAERRSAIVTGVTAQATERGLTPVYDDALLDEVVHLVEWPVPLVGTFDESLLEVPREVLITSMASHQRYFALQDASGTLANAFAFVSNMVVPDPDVVVAGNLRVLRARLEDARFFYREDRKRSLADRVGDLERVVYIDRLGSVAARARRIERLAGHLAGVLYPGDRAIADHATRAAHLCKTDLVTGMVYEFPELQGIMGRYYAVADGEPAAVADAIADHYAPRGASDATPDQPASICVALADKLDAIVGCIALGLMPSGSADPWALRRAAIGIVRTSIDRGLRFDLSAIVAWAWDGLEADDLRPREQTVNDVVDFVLGRLRALLAVDRPVDIVDAVVAVAADDIPSTPERVRVLDELRSNADFEPLAAAFKRVVNIVRKATDGAPELAAQLAHVDAVRTDLLSDDAERALFDALSDARPSIDADVDQGRFAEAASTLIALKPAIDRFFDDVLVNAEDPAVRHNRLALLARVEAAFTQVADISRIQASRT